MEATTRPKVLIAHRGASAYAPEHTLAAYQLALDQKADFVEPDLQITGDGILICMHDPTLERTTNVADVFPDRYRKEAERRTIRRRWHAADFTLSEIKQLDAGSWFDSRFVDARIPTLMEAIELVIGRAGLYPETKALGVGEERSFDIERQLLQDLERYSLVAPDLKEVAPVVVQSFSEESLKALRHDLGSALPLVLLLAEPSGRLTPAGLADLGEFASGVAPAKRLIERDPSIVERAHAAGLSVSAWTFGSDDPGEFAGVKEEMAHFLYERGVDGLFTNNPDLFPREGI